ncbi:hypothetical protein FHU30_007247 [Actinomadura rupiterrae]|nr:hypothetical protein [Actinomadura rupiterrae]
MSADAGPKAPGRRRGVVLLGPASSAIPRSCMLLVDAIASAG